MMLPYSSRQLELLMPRKGEEEEDQEVEEAM